VKRIFWLIVGIAVGVYAVTRLKKRAQILAPDSVQAMPAVKNWLTNAATALCVAEALDEKHQGVPVDFIRRVTEQNVLLQIQHLRTHASVAAAMVRDELTISGWVYEIGTGEVRIWEESKKAFVPVGKSA